MEGRIPPHNHEAEQAVIGAIAQASHVVGKVMASLDESDFFARTHSEIYRAARVLFEAGAEIDLVTLVSELRRVGTLEAVGGAIYITECIDACPAPSAALKYCEVLSGMSLRRRLIESAAGIISKSFDESEDPLVILADAGDAVMAAGRAHARGLGEVPDPRDLVAAFDAEQGRPVKQLMTPFDWLNQMTSGLMPTDLITIAGRTSAGKSAMALQIAKHVAAEGKVLYITLEMAPSQMLARYIAGETSITMRELRMHKVDPGDKAEYEAALARYAKSQLYFTAAAGDIASIVRIVRGMRPTLVIVDTMNLVKAPGESLRVKMRNVTGDLKQLAMSEGIAVIMLAQVSRAADVKVVPTMSDLQETSSIEQDSDVVLMLTEIESAKKFRKLVDDGHVDIGVDATEYATMKRYGQRLIYAMVQKNRNDRLGSAAFRFEGKRFTFAEIGEAQQQYFALPTEESNDDPPWM